MVGQGRVSHAALCLMLLATVALPCAAAAPAATAVPARAAPGADVRLEFVIPSSDLLQAAVLENVTCTISGGAGGSAPCGAYGSLVEARVTPSGQSYVFTTKAPAASGNYTVRFARSSLIPLLDADATAEAAFEVAPDGDSGATTGPGPSGGDQPLEQNAGPGTGTSGTPADALQDGARWTLSMMLGTGAILGCLVATRPRIRGP